MIAPFASVLSLYNNDPQDFGDPYDLDGHRLLAQVEANPSDGDADYVQDLGPGDYFVAISGAGNLDFSPVIAGSGYDGATGSYELTIHATDLGLSGDGPTVLSSDPAAGAVLDSSPLAIRLEMSGPLDPGTIVPGQTVQLYSGTGRDGRRRLRQSGRAGLGQFLRRRPTSSSSSRWRPGARELCDLARRRFEHGPARTGRSERCPARRGRRASRGRRRGRSRSRSTVSTA